SPSLPLFPYTTLFRSGAASGVDYSAFLAQAETPEFNGRVIHALLNDPALAQLSGQTLISAEQAVRYGIVDADQRQPASLRQQLRSEEHTSELQSREKL